MANLRGVNTTAATPTCRNIPHFIKWMEKLWVRKKRRRGERVDQVVDSRQQALEFNDCSPIFVVPQNGLLGMSLGSYSRGKMFKNRVVEFLHDDGAKFEVQSCGRRQVRWFARLPLRRLRLRVDGPSLGRFDRREAPSALGDRSQIKYPSRRIWFDPEVPFGQRGGSLEAGGDSF